MKKIKISTTLLLAVIISLTSCGNKKKQSEELSVKKTEIAQVVSDVVYPLPSSMELMELLNEIDAAYILGITNPAEGVEQYEAIEKQAINLGIYLSDLSYASIYKRKQAAQDYLTACESLVDKLHVSSAFEDDFIANIANNIDNRDSLVSLITTATQTIYGEFQTKDQMDLAYLMVSGAWVESMYLTLEVSKNTPLNEKIISTVFFQHESLVKTIELLKTSTEKPEVLIAALEGINNTLASEEPKSLTIEQVEKLTAQTNALRARMIKAEISK